MPILERPTPQILSGFLRFLKDPAFSSVKGPVVQRRNSSTNNQNSVALIGSNPNTQFTPSFMDWRLDIQQLIGEQNVFLKLHASKIELNESFGSARVKDSTSQAAHFPKTEPN